MRSRILDAWAVLTGRKIAVARVPAFAVYSESNTSVAGNTSFTWR